MTNTRECQAKDPSACRFHGQPNILSELRHEQQEALERGDTDEYLKIREKADRINERFIQQEISIQEDGERNLKINGETSENEATNRSRAESAANYAIESAFKDYHNSTYAEQEEELRTQLLLNNNKAIVAGLFDLEGNMVTAKIVQVEDQYTRTKEPVWAIIDGNDPKGRVKEWFRPSKAKNEKTALANNAKKGYYIGMILHPARIQRQTHSTLAGSRSWPEIVKQWDTPFDSEDITVLDNGHNPSE